MFCYALCLVPGYCFPQYFQDEEQDTVKAVAEPVVLYKKKVNFYFTAEFMVPDRKMQVYYRPDPSVANPNQAWDIYIINHVTKPWMRRIEYSNLKGLGAMVSLKLHHEIHFAAGLNCVFNKFEARTWCDSLYDRGGNWVSGDHAKTLTASFSVPLQVDCRINKYVFIFFSLKPQLCRFNREDYKSYRLIGYNFFEAYSEKKREVELGYLFMPASAGVSLNLFNTNRMYLDLSLMESASFSNDVTVYYTAGLRYYVF